MSHAVQLFLAAALGGFIGSIYTDMRHRARSRRACPCRCRR